MSARPFKSEHEQGYPIASRAPLLWAPLADDGEDDDEYDSHQRRYSATNSEYATNLPYGSSAPVTTGSYASYNYPTPTTSHATYPTGYTYGNQPYLTPYPQPNTTSNARLPTVYRPQYSNTEYSDAYSPAHLTTPAITHSHAAPLTTSADDWSSSYNNHNSYGNSNGNPTPVYTTTNDLTRTSSQRSEGNRSQNSNDGRDRRFICNRYINDDTECSAAFVRKADLTRHIDCVHDKRPQYGCPVRNCSRKGDQGFTRRDHRTEHLRHFHHRDIPKRSRGNQHVDEEDDDDVPPF